DKAPHSRSLPRQAPSQKCRDGLKTVKLRLLRARRLAPGLLINVCRDRLPDGKAEIVGIHGVQLPALGSVLSDEPGVAGVGGLGLYINRWQDAAVLGRQGDALQYRLPPVPFEPLR